MTDTATVRTLRWRPTLGFGARLRLVRIDYAERVGHRVNQDEMAELVNAKPGTYRSWEAGNSKPADLTETAMTIYRVTGADPAWLLGLDDENGPNLPPTQGISQLSWKDDLAGRRARREVVRPLELAEAS